MMLYLTGAVDRRRVGPKLEAGLRRAGYSVDVTTPDDEGTQFDPDRGVIFHFSGDRVLQSLVVAPEYVDIAQQLCKTNGVTLQRIDDYESDLPCVAWTVDKQSDAVVGQLAHDLASAGLEISVMVVGRG